jgi:glycosyltransferase involved in cell wall biosynthesis
MKNIFILTHNSEISGPVDYFQRYLERNNYKITRLEHPLDNYERRFTIFYSENKFRKVKRIHVFGILNLFIDFFISLIAILKTNFNIFGAANNFDTFTDIFVRKIFRKKVEKIIYFASDFSEDRFSNVLLNKVYYFIESICCKYSDLVISNTKRAEEKRLKFGLKKEKSIVVPNGVLLEKEDFNKKELNKNNFIFVGSVTKEHGLYDLIKTIYPLINKLVLIGYGDDWDRVVSICKEKSIKIETYYKKDHKFCIDYMQKFNGFGLAPYNFNSKWTYYCSPLKVVEYIACGLPVLMSSVPEIASYIKENGLGVVYSELDYNKISNDLKLFDIGGFNLKAKKFYSIYNQNNLYSKIPL